LSTVLADDPRLDESQVRHDDLVMAGLVPAIYAH
jgi:hypothetical protein